MRGKWDTEEPLVHAPNQQRQQQQQHTIIEEQRHHPLHTATTPGWAIADRIVKEEPMEDKNNDSGVSPDHYTSNSASPRSRRSSSTANCSLSPGSATSQDSSSNIQCSNFEYSPQRVFKNCGSPQDFPRNPSIDDHRTDQPMDIVTSSVKPSCEDAEIGQDTLQCPICAFTTLNRLKFTEHLTSHCNTKCQTPEFVKTVLNQLSTGVVQDESNGEFPSHGERSEHESEEADEPGLRVPRVNSQGKVKTFRCKQCNFVAITKLEFWEHSRGHIKAEKLLTCPKCPFVTEYKHHLEYHLRNHFGSKPFKCDKCSYSCVNKSMLNSHLKSHSNVYQYRCANCSYATKYCHSLKLHLRKYSHQPAMVLNADGSPNPLPIIDIYGTRRGPKQKPIKTDDELTQQQQQTNLTNNNLQVPLTVTPQISPLGHHLPAVAPIVGLNGINGLAGVNGLNGLNNGNGLAQGQPMMGFPYNQLFAGFSLPQRYPLPDEATAGDKWRTNGLVDYLKTMDTDRGENDTSQDTSRCYNVTKALNGHPTSPVYPQTMMSNGDTVGSTTPPSPGIVQEDDPAGTKNAPLDLSKPDVGSTVGQQRAVNSPKASGTSRRKGIAVKLERRVLEDDDEPALVLVQPDQEETFEPPAASSPGSRDAQKPANNEQQQQQSNGGASSVGNEFTCQYCEIAFGNVVMYTVHMGYHGYNDPYTCNMCGHQCTDKVSFFLHIARSKHS